MKKFLILVLTVCMLVPMFCIDSFAYKIGDVVNYVLYTDIVTYINGYPIQSYNIDGYTAVVVEDLAEYGFNVVWNQKNRSLSVVRNMAKGITSKYKVTPNTRPIGSKAMAVLYTDIVTYLDGVKVTSYNVDGRTIIYVDDIAKFYAKNYVWSAGKRTLNLTLKTPEPVNPTPVNPTPVDPAPIQPVKPDYNWSWEYSERDISVDYMYYGFSIDLASDGIGGFRRTSSAGSIKAVDKISIDSSSAGFRINTQQIRNIEGNVLANLKENLNFDATGKLKTVSDTVAQRRKLTSYISVKINGTEVQGYLSNINLAGYEGYAINFDENNMFEYKDIKTLSIRVGEIREQTEYVNVQDAINLKIPVTFASWGGSMVTTTQKDCTFRVPAIGSNVIGAQFINSMIMNDFNNYKFFGGMTNAEYVEYIKRYGTGMNASYGTDSWYYRTVDYTTERSGTKVIIHVTYTTYPIDGGEYYDEASYWFDYSLGTYGSLGGTKTNYIDTATQLSSLNLSSNDRRYMFLNYFLGKNIDKLEEFDGVSKGSYSTFKDITIDKYIISVSGANKDVTLLMNISKSNIETIPSGRYIIAIPSDVRLFKLFDFTQPDGGTQGAIPGYESLARKAVRTWLENSADYMIYDSKGLEALTANSSAVYGRGIYDFLIEFFGPSTGTQLVERAKTIFGVSQFVPMGQADRFTGMFSSRTTNGHVWYYDIVSETNGSSGETVVRVQFYADFAKSVKSYVVDYNVIANSYSFGFVSAKTVTGSTAAAPVAPPAHYVNP